MPNTRARALSCVLALTTAVTLAACTTPAAKNTPTNTRTPAVTSPATPGSESPSTGKAAPPPIPTRDKDGKNPATVVDVTVDRSPAGMSPGDGILVAGTAGVGTKVTVYTDYRCPHCKAFHGYTKDRVAAAAEAGTIHVYEVPVNRLDLVGDTAYSSRAATAAYCAATEGTPSPELSAKVSDALFGLQPDGDGDGPDQGAVWDALAGAGVSDEVSECVADEYRFALFAVEQRNIAYRAGMTVVPTVAVDGELLPYPDGENADQAYADLLFDTVG